MICVVCANEQIGNCAICEIVQTARGNLEYDAGAMCALCRDNDGRLREASAHKNGWIFGKFLNGGFKNEGVLRW